MYLVAIELRLTTSSTFKDYAHVGTPSPCIFENLSVRFSSVGDDDRAFMLTIHFLQGLAIPLCELAHSQQTR